MSVPRGLSEAEQAAWAKLARSVTPIAGRKRPQAPEKREDQAAKTAPAKKPPAKSAPPRKVAAPPRAAAAAAPPPQRRFDSQLDGHWNRKLKAGQVAPDYTLDLHGSTLDGAYERVMRGLDQACAMDARVVLVIAGRERPVDPADRGTRRGAIRAKLLDWLAVSRHGEAIAAVRKAHQRHGGAGALYLVLRRSR